MGFRDTKNIFDHRKDQTLGDLYDEATALNETLTNESGIDIRNTRLAVLRWKRHQPSGSFLHAHGFTGFKTMRDQRPDGAVIRSTVVDNNLHVCFVANDVGDAYALIPIESNGEPVQRNIDILVNVGQDKSCPWTIENEDVRLLIEGLMPKEERKPMGRPKKIQIEDSET
jgi:hypothetical protein